MTTHFKKLPLIHLLEELKKLDYQFTTITPLSHERVNNRPENKWARDLRGIFGWSRPFHKDLIPENLFELLQSAQVLSVFENGWRSSIRVSSLEGQLFIHSAFPTTDNDAVFFGPDTYRYVKAIKDYLIHKQPEVSRAADIGCGSGAGAIFLALAIPDATILALDISDKALALTEINASPPTTTNVITLKSNILQQTDGEFNLIIANPPYLMDGSHRAYRDGGGALGAELSLAIVDEAIGKLGSKGTLLLYTGIAIEHGEDRFRAEIERRLDSPDFEFTYSELDPDIFGEELERECYRYIDRIACVLLTVTRAT